MHRTTVRFWEAFAGLPPEVQTLARKKFELLKNNPTHPSLNLKKVGRYWSVRLHLDHRALGIKEEGEYIRIWIGDHSEYAEIIRR